MKARRFAKKNTHSTKRLPRKWGIVIGSLLGIGLVYGLIFLVPKSVDFAYADANCARQLVLFPTVHRQQGDEGYAITAEDKLEVGGVPVLSTKVCVEPTKSPEVGVSTVQVSPFGGPLFAKKFQITTPEAPVVAVGALKDKKIPAGRSLSVAISEGDTVNSYAIAANGTKAPCTTKEAELVCDVPALKLSHGTPYTVAITRSFPGEKEAETLGEASVATLDPMLITKSPLTTGTIIYDTPKEFAFEASRGIDAVKATISLKKDGVEQPAVELKEKVDGSKFVATLKDPLERKATYVLKLLEVNGTDGGTLAGDTHYEFATSGGPKVSGVSAAAGNVEQGERIVLTFDQPIDASVDVGAFIRATGVKATTALISETQVAVTLQDAPLCAAFSVVVDKGMKSGSNGTTADEAWKFDSRIACGTSSVIGYSVKGRPIVAHYFGSGPTTLLFTAGIHGSEPSSTTTMQAWVEYLKTNAHKLPGDKRLVIVPNANPDGIAAGSRNNANNVNLGRNYPTANWKADIETANGVLTNGGGTSAGSEPETAALLKLTRQIRPRLEISFHAQGSLVGANKFGDSVAVGDIYAKLVGYRTMFYNAEAVMGYPMTGEYEDWMGEELGTPAILIELPRSSGNYLNSQLSALLRMTTL